LVLHDAHLSGHMSVMWSQSWRITPFSVVLSILYF